MHGTSSLREKIQNPNSNYSAHYLIPLLRSYIVIHNTLSIPTTLRSQYGRMRDRLGSGCRVPKQRGGNTLKSDFHLYNFCYQRDGRVNTRHAGTIFSRKISVWYCHLIDQMLCCWCNSCHLIGPRVTWRLRRTLWLPGGISASLEGLSLRWPGNFTHLT